MPGPSILGAHSTFLTSDSFRCTGPPHAKAYSRVVEVNREVKGFSIVANDFVLHLVLRLTPIRINHLGPVVQSPITVNSRLADTPLLQTPR